MKAFAGLSLFLALTTACQMESRSMFSEKKSGDKGLQNSSVARSVHSLKDESGRLECVGVTSGLHFVRTRADFTKGKLSSLNVEAFYNSKSPSQVPNQLTPNLKNYLVFSHELSTKIQDLELDLDGKKFSIEVVAELNGKARKIYELDMSIGPDGEGDLLLNGYLSYKDTSIPMDLSELFVGCTVLPESD